MNSLLLSPFHSIDKKEDSLMEEARGEENGSGIERESWVRKCSFLLQCISRHFS